MGRKFKIFLGILIGALFLCLLLWKHYINAPLMFSPGITEKSPIKGFSQESYEAWLQAPQELKASLAKPLIQQVLEDLKYNTWMDFIDHITLRSYTQQVLPGKDPQLLMLVNLSKDLSGMGIYTLKNGTYSLVDKIEGLLFVDEVTFIPLEARDYQGILISQTLDERLGSFFLSKFIDLYYFHEKDLERVWHKDVYQEEIYRENWIWEKGDPSLWVRVVKATELVHIPGNPYQIKILSRLTKAQVHSEVFPNPEDFKTIASEEFQESYYWSPTYHTFILGELSQEVFLTPSALIEDGHYSIEQLYGFDNDYYRLKTQQGEIFYLPGSNFKGLLQFLPEE